MSNMTRRKEEIPVRDRKGVHGPNALDALDALKEVVGKYLEYKNTREHERANRRKIAAEERVSLADIEMKRTLFMEYMSRSFDERKQNFDALFKRLDRAIEKDDMQALAVVASTITELAKSSPFKDLATIAAARKALENPDHEWEV